MKFKKCELHTNDTRQAISLLDIKILDIFHGKDTLRYINCLFTRYRKTHNATELVKKLRQELSKL
jgi:hypothetical protein